MSVNNGLQQRRKPKVEKENQPSFLQPKEEVIWTGGNGRKEPGLEKYRLNKIDNSLVISEAGYPEFE